MGLALMLCHRCRAPSKIIAWHGTEQRTRECANGHRWKTSVLEIRDTHPSEPATAETVRAMRERGMGFREIAKALHISSATAQRWAAPADIAEVWR